MHIARGKRRKEKWGRHRHEVFSLAFLSWVQNDLTPEQLQWITAAIASHHRDLDEINSLYLSPDEDEDDPLSTHLGEIKVETLRGLWRWLSECAPVWIETMGLSELGVKPLSIVPQEEAIKLNTRSRGKKYSFIPEILSPLCSILERSRAKFPC